MPDTRSVKLCRVIDGDTVIVKPRGMRGWFAQPERIRLYGIDAPESDQKGGEAATKYLRKIIRADGGLRMEVSDKDHYGRTVGLIYHRRQGRLNSYNRQMVAAGHAYWYKQYGGADLGFPEAEAAARQARKGVWRASKRELPWDYRKRQKQKQAKAGKLRFRLILFTLALIAVIALALYAYGRASGYEGELRERVTERVADAREWRDRMVQYYRVIKP